MDDSTRDRLTLGSSTKRSASSASLDRGASVASKYRPASSCSLSSDTFLYPITRTPSAIFPESRAPSRQGLSMIKTNESSPPPTDLSFEDAVQLLHKLERRLRLEVEADLVELRMQMTARKIDYVSRKAQRLYTIRQQLGACRVLCRQEEEVMREFDKVKRLLEQQTTIDEDEYKRTKVDCLVLGGKLTDIRRRQRRLSGQVEELESTIKELMDSTQQDDMDDEEFDLEMFKRRPLEDEPRLAPALSSYSLFNNSPTGGPSQGPPIKITTSYSSDSLAFLASDDGASEIPDNPSPVPSHLTSDRESEFGRYFKGRDTTDFSQDDRDSEAYFPQSVGGPKRKKKKRSEYTPRNRTESMSSDTDGEEVWNLREGPLKDRMSADEAKKVAELKQRQIEEEKRIEDAEQQRIRYEIEAKKKEENEKEAEEIRIEEKIKQAELEVKKKEEEARKTEELEAKRKAAEEKRIAFEEKKKAELETKKKEEEEKKRIEAEKKKAELEAKRAASAQKKKELEEKKKIELEVRQKAELEAKQQAELEAKQKAELEAQQEEELKAQQQAQQEAKQKAEESLRFQQEEESRILREEQERIEQENARISFEEKIAMEQENARLAYEEQIAIEQENARIAYEEQMAIEQDNARIQYEEQIRINEENVICEQEQTLRNQHAQLLAEQEEETQRQELIYQQELEIMEAEKIAEQDIPKPPKKGRSASRDRQAASKAVAEDEIDEMLYDDQHQIKDKEDLFAMIGDTSLKGGKFRQKKVSGSEDAEEEMFTRSSRSKKNSTSSNQDAFGEDQNSDFSNQGAKTRTPSRDRQNVQQGECERPRSAGKSRNISGEDPLLQDYFAEQENIYSSTDSMIERAEGFEDDQGWRSDKHDYEESFQSGYVYENREEADSSHQEGRDDSSVYSRARKDSRMSAKYNEDDEVPVPERKPKSKTASKERPNNQSSSEIANEDSFLEADQTQDIIGKPSRPGSRQTQQDPANTLKSRTTSRERPNTQTVQKDFYGELEDDENNESGFKINAESSKDQSRSIKSRTTSQDRSRNVVERDQDFFQPEDVEIGNTYPRTASRPESRQDQPGMLKSRTTSRERPQSSRSAQEYQDNYEEDEDVEMMEEVNTNMKKSSGPQSRASQNDPSQRCASRTGSREGHIDVVSSQGYVPELEDGNGEFEPMRKSSRPQSRVSQNDAQQRSNSRTGSNERPANLGPTQDFYDEPELEENFEEFLDQTQKSSRPHSRTSQREGVSKLNTRTGSRESPVDFSSYQDFGSEDDSKFTEAGEYEVKSSSRPLSRQNQQMQKSRSGSRDTHSLHEEHEGADFETIQQDPTKRVLKSRTSSSERPVRFISDNQPENEIESDFMMQDEQYGSQKDSKQRVKSRTASGDRRGAPRNSESEFDNELVTGVRPKSRTDSKERGQRNTGDQFGELGNYPDEIDFDENLDRQQETRYQKSRTSSRDRSKQLDSALEFQTGELGRAGKSRSASNDRNASRERKSDLDHYKVGENEDIYAQVRTRRDKVTHSRTTSRERPGGSNHSGSQPVGLDDEYDDEDVPGLESAGVEENFSGKSKRFTKSRTTSFERPEIPERGYDNESFAEQTMEGPNENESKSFIEKQVKSRTTSRERPQTLDLPSNSLEIDSDGQLIPMMSKQNRSRTASRERPRSHMAEQLEMEIGPKSRSASREGRKNHVDTMELEDYLSAPSSRLAKSRTASRDRQSHWPDDLPQGASRLLDEGNQEVPFAKSRTHSRDRNQGDNTRNNLMGEDDGYNTMTGRLKRYKDEEALDLAAAEASNEHFEPDYGTLDSGISDYYQQGRNSNNSTIERSRDFEGQEFGNQSLQSDRTDHFQRYPQSHIAVNPEYDLDYSFNEYYQNQNEGLNQDAEIDQQGQSTVMDDEQARSRTKKVSFAEEDEKFVLRPDPEVKIIPGTKLFCFAPSETHEQPPEPEDRSPPASNGNGSIGLSLRVKEKENIPVSPNLLHSPARSEERQMSNSPKAFLKAMLGAKPSKDATSENGERRSLFDTLLRRGRSASLQGSRNNSRQNSLDRGAVSEKGASRNFTTSVSFDTGMQQNLGGGVGTNLSGPAAGSSRATDSSVGSVELNLDQEGSDMESEYSLFKKSGGKKKKPPKVKSVDFDQLFARGHAIGEQREKQTQSMTGLSSIPNIARDFPPFPDGHNPTPFEIYSKEDAFKQAQQGAGISYEEKVQSYLDDQLHQHGSIDPQQQQQQQLFSQYSTDSASMPADGHESRKAERKLKRERSRSDSNKRSKDLSLERKKEPPKVIGYAKPEDIHIEMTGESVIQVSPPSTLQRSNSRMSNGGRPVDSDAFLQNIQEFVRKAEVDQEYSQPVWPAIIQSPNDLPPTKAQAKAMQMTQGQRYPEQMQHQFGNASPRPVSPYDNQNPNPFNFNMATGPVPRSPQNGYSMNANQEFQRPVSPYDLQGNFGQQQRRQSSDGRSTVLNQQMPSINQQSGSLDQHRRQSSDGRIVAPNIYQQGPASPYNNQQDNGLQAQRRESSDGRLMAPTNNQQRPPSPYQMQGQNDETGFSQQRTASPYQMQRPSPGKSYLDMQPNIMSDPFQSQFDQYDGPPPTPAEAASIILQSLSLRAASAQDQRPTPSPRRGRSPRMDLQNMPGDAHIPNMLRPDPLTAHELLPPPIFGSTLQTTQQLKLANGGQEEPAQTIKDTDLYKRLQEGLKNIDKILASESFQEKIKAAGLENQKYSHHLGRAEFGVLKKRSGSTASVPAVSTVGAPLTKSASAAALSGAIPKGTQRAGSVQAVASAQSRDSSGERPASAMGGSARYQPITVGRGRQSNYSSQQGSRDSSLGRPDSRQSNYSAMPDLEPGFNNLAQQAFALGMEQTEGESRVIYIEPHPEICEKKREVMHQLALERIAVKEAKVWVQVFLLFVLCLCVLVYLQSEG